MIKKLSLAVMIMCSVGSVFAATPAVKDEVMFSPALSYHMFDDQRTVKNGIELGLYATKALTDKFSAEANGGLVFSKHKSGDSPKFIPELGLNAVYDIANINKMTPYVLAGLSIEAAEDILAGFDLGVGVKYKVSKFFQPRLEVKNINHGTYHGSDWVVSLLLSFPVVSDKLEESFAKTGKIEKMNMNINFDTNSTEVKAEYLQTLADYAEFLSNHPELKIAINGYTDNTGGADYNLTLSQKRAQSVATVLNEKYGIAKDRITSKGYGDADPVAPNDTPENQAKNRRIEANTTK